MVDYTDFAELLSLTRVAGGMQAHPSIRAHLVQQGWITTDQRITEAGKHRLAALKGTTK